MHCCCAFPFALAGLFCTFTLPFLPFTAQHSDRPTTYGLLTVTQKFTVSDVTTAMHRHAATVGP